MPLRNSLNVSGNLTANNFLFPGGASASLTVGDTPPAVATNGSLWLNSNNLNTYVYYNDGDSSQWISAGSIVSGTSFFPSQANNSGKYLTTDGTTASWANVSALPTQTGNSGKYLTTNGTTASWDNVSALPTQTGNSGKYLTTNGTTASWANVSSFTSSQAYTMSILFGGS